MYPAIIAEGGREAARRLGIGEGGALSFLLTDEAHDTTQLLAIHDVCASGQPRADVDRGAVAIAELVIDPLHGLEHVPAGEALLHHREEAIEDVQDEKRATE
jgi:hypothetical protein